ncbi:hypothetical protein KOR34_24280 [Posidoniimonas corsicana]|uniref:Uncharacterized protein n=1 Tax=Posidoniimonas corsicana TaxID=1938618 RepID=A0A5C5VFV4_9BACT|nr:DUF1580 domain-containing protein [Posidoniimonas corsicana]TWT37476.1 hypothetical protein KOR34_24280 [Posidoniimonas corsicana]
MSANATATLREDLFAPDPDDPFRSIAAAVEAETGYRPHPTTACRWHRVGVGGVRLQTVTLGARPMTTRRAVREFIRARTEAQASAEG